MLHCSVGDARAFMGGEQRTGAGIPSPLLKQTFLFPITTVITELAIVFTLKGFRGEGGTFMVMNWLIT